MYTPDSPIGAGDRAPDFSLPDSTGAPINLYTRVRGGTPLLVFYPDAARFAVEAAQLHSVMEQVPPGEMDLFVIVGAPVDSLPAASGEAVYVVADPVGDTAKAYGFTAISGTLALRFYPNLRLTALRTVGVEAVARYVERHLAQSPPPSQLVSILAPALIVPHVLSADFCHELIPSIIPAAMKPAPSATTRMIAMFEKCIRIKKGIIYQFTQPARHSDRDQCASNNPIASSAVPA